jgi:hypothetical protein
MSEPILHPVVSILVEMLRSDGPCLSAESIAFLEKTLQQIQDRDEMLFAGRSILSVAYVAERSLAEVLLSLVARLAGRLSELGQSTAPSPDEAQERRFQSFLGRARVRDPETPGDTTGVVSVGSLLDKVGIPRR